MKQLMYGLATATVLLTGCGQAKESDKKVTTCKTRKTNVSRQTTASGLQYEIIKEGTGATPTAGKVVTVHYTGWLDNNGELGAKFDSSVDRGKPFQFVIGKGQVIKGWDEGVLGMKVGEKRRLIIPASLGYGARGAAGVIPGNATLIFDVELIAV